MNSKQIFCPIHGFINITPLMQQIIDTPEFKRLHNLRQAGVAYLVFPSANHTRFEHSIGVSHLAGKLITQLKTNQPELNISDRVIELVRVAGLIHDIGHGPFSHLYDTVMSKYKLPHHEERGIEIFKNIVEKYNISLSAEEIKMIIKMVEPDETIKNNYLYQIVANKVCSVDVDKIDYIERDSYHLGIRTMTDYQRLITMARVVECDGNFQLAWPEKLQHDILSLFETRYRLHKNVYHHHAVKSAEILVGEIMTNIIDSLEDKTSLHMTNDMIVYYYRSNNETMNNELIRLRNEIDMRHFPKMIGEKVIPYINNENDITKINLFQNKLDMLTNKLNSISIKNTGWKRITIGFITGSGENPLREVIYFNHKNINIGYRLKEYSSFMEPKNYKEYIYRMYILNKQDFNYAQNQWDTLIE